MAKEKEVVFQQQGPKSFLKVRMDWANIGKIHLSFVAHEGRDNNFKQVNSIEAALKTGGAGREDALYFAAAIRNGKMAEKRMRSLQKQNADGAKYPEVIFTSNGGSPAKGDKPCKWRMVTMAPGIKTDYVIAAVESEGVVNKLGGYMKKEGAAETRISIGISEDELLAMASAIEMGWQAYLTNPNAFSRTPAAEPANEANAAPAGVYVVYDTLGEYCDVVSTPEGALAAMQRIISAMSTRKDGAYKRTTNDQYESAKQALLNDCDEFPVVPLTSLTDSSDTCNVIVARRQLNG